MIRGACAVVAVKQKKQVKVVGPISRAVCVAGPVAVVATTTRAQAATAADQQAQLLLWVMVNTKVTVTAGDTTRRNTAMVITSRADL